jgi:hypothetical protein
MLPVTRTLLPLLAVVGALLLATAAEAAPLCRWVDDSGRTQISDSVPDRYRSSAVCTDSRQYELSPQQRQEAEQRAARQKAQARQERSGQATERAGAASEPGSAASGSVAKRPAQGVTDATDCDTWWRLYDESEECFGPYRTTRGATKPEAFEKCNVIARPELKCGPRRN